MSELYTLEELQQLSMEIYSFVQEYVIKEQQREQEINACCSQVDVDSIVITF